MASDLGIPEESKTNNNKHHALFSSSSSQQQQPPFLVVVVPGQVIATAPLDSAEFLRGHGTYMERTADNGEERLIASVVGRVQRVNKLIHVEPVASSLYQGQVGDLVVGRITAVAAARWKVQLLSSSGNNGQEASLPLSGVHLPGGVQRVRTAQDARDMRQFLQEGDLVSAEVHKVQNNDGTLMLHTRSHRYGKLDNG
jgi:exosome complex component RRP4